MPRIPRIRKTIFPDQMFMNRKTGKLERRDFFPDEWDRVYPTHTPVQGPELPYKLEERRQWLRNAQDAYEADLAEERARQAYNRKVAAWNSYKTLPERQRVWIANKDAIKSYLGPEMWGYDEKELDRINTIDELEEYLQTRHPEDGWPNQYPLYNDEVTPVFESFEDFPDELSDAPWRMW